jgi:hypothetical protein
MYVFVDQMFSHIMLQAAVPENELSGRTTFFIVRLPDTKQV